MAFPFRNKGDEWPYCDSWLIIALGKTKKGGILTRHMNESGFVDTVTTTTTTGKRELFADGAFIIVVYLRTTLHAFR